MPSTELVYATIAADEGVLDAVRREIDAGNLGRAAEIAAYEHGRGVRHTLLLNLMAHRAEEERRFEVALGYLQAALEIDPHDPTILHAVGQCLAKMGLQGKALTAFDAALLHRPDYPAALHHKGLALELLGEDEAAASHFAAAARYDPGYADPRAGMASVAARAGRMKEARDHARSALKLDPGQSTAAIALATVELAEKAYDEAEKRLRACLADPKLDALDRPAATILLGDVLDAQGKADQAFAVYVEGKRLAGEAFEAMPGRVGAESQVVLAERLEVWLRSLERWPVSHPVRSSPAREHVFLVGFPRSGTTLLEQILASHSDIVTLDERAALDIAGLDLLRDAAGLTQLLELDSQALEMRRAQYWKAVAGVGLRVEGQVLVDKLPLNTLKLPLIARLFPNAKILFAERDPRDVVLSCFRRNFKMNTSMAEFVTLERAARFYDAVMRTGAIAREKLPLDLLAVRHETLVTDFEAQARRVCDFLGVEWQPQMADFAKTAAARNIRTPSAVQVRRGLYTDALGQWRRYARHLTPVAPILAPWVDAMGYEPA